MATLYAQSTGNWDAILWNTAANGSGTNETPAAADTLISNNYTVTVNGNYIVTKVTNTGGGTFTLADGVTLTCTDATAGVVGDAANVGTVTFALTGEGDTATLTAKVLGGNGANEYGVLVSGTKTLTVNGTVTGGSFSGAEATGACGLYISAAATVAVNNPGSNAVIGGSGAFGHGIKSIDASTLTVSGHPVGGSGNSTIYGINNTSTGTVTVTGNPTSGIYGNTHGINNASTGAVTVTGNPTGTGSNTHGINNASTGAVTVTGNPVGGSSVGHGINNASTGTVTVTGNPVGGVGGGYGINNASTGSVTVNGACLASANSHAIGGALPGQITILTGPLLSYATSGAGGVNPVIAARWFIKETAIGGFYYELRSETDVGGERAARKLSYEPPAYPVVGDVRSGTAYGALTGTCHVPVAASVLVGVPVDNTVGTAQVNSASTADIAAAVWDTLIADLDTADSIGARLAQAATVPSTGAQIAALGV